MTVHIISVNRCFYKRCNEDVITHQGTFIVFIGTIVDTDYNSVGERKEGDCILSLFVGCLDFMKNFLRDHKKVEISVNHTPSRVFPHLA